MYNCQVSHHVLIVHRPEFASINFFRFHVHIRTSRSSREVITVRRVDEFIADLLIDLFVLREYMLVVNFLLGGDGSAS